MKIEELIKYGTEFLTNKDEKEARYIAKELLSNFINKDNTYLVINKDKEIEKDIELKYIMALEKILNGTPIQYIINNQNFMGIEFYVDENVLIPQPDTEVLVEEVIRISNNENKKKILDLCTGSGAIAISLKNTIENIDVVASDISKNALDVAKRNAKKCNVNIEFIQSNLFEKIEDKFDIITSNPPYIKTEVIKTLDKEVQNEPVIALDGGKDGLEFYRKIIKQAKKYLYDNGCLALEIGFDQKEEVVKIFQNEGYKQIYSKKDFGNNDRIVIGKK